MSKKEKCKKCGGISRNASFFDTECKCYAKKENYYKSGYDDGLIDGMILGDIVDTIAEAFFDDD